MRLSREGKRFCLATLLIAVASFNTGNNLIYLIFGMMLSILIISVAVLTMNLRGLSLRLKQEPHLFAGRPSEIEITLVNSRKVVPAYSVRVHLPARIRGDTYFSHVPTASEDTQTVTVVFKKRGLYRYGDFSLESSFPFIFFSKKASARVAGHVLVYPEMRDIDEHIVLPSGEGSGTAVSRTGRGDEFSTVREFRYGDDWRRVHWKASAKTSKLMVMQYAAEEQKKITVMLDNLMPPDNDAFERSVSFAASLCEKYLERGYFLRLVTCGKLIPFGSGMEHLFKILDLLAVIKPQTTWECPFTEEPEGTSILILNSEESPLSKYAAVSDMVIHAATV